MSEFVPRILAFCCNYCAYVAADLAGVSRLQYPTNLRIIRVPCTGKVDIIYIIRAFEKGFDGVYLAGCLQGGCHFLEGNLHAEKRVEFAKDLLEAIGINSERLEMFFISASMAPKFSEVAREMTDRITKLGPALPNKLELTKMDPESTKREYLYDMLRNIALKIPEKPIPVPEGLEEFGKISIDLTKCIGCKKCDEVCPEKAIETISIFDLPTILLNLTDITEGKVTKRHRLYETIAKIAVKSPSGAIPVPEELNEFWKMEYIAKKCVTCEKCSVICPEKAIQIIRELDLPAVFAQTS
jgi:coenzyme F420-reducing hydrogenase delta subunit/ferredoxin